MASERKRGWKVSESTPFFQTCGPARDRRRCGEGRDRCYGISSAQLGMLALLMMSGFGCAARSDREGCAVEELIIA
jgi:hypothetical protein